MKSVILVLATVLIYALNPSDGLKCEKSVGYIENEFGTPYAFTKSKVDCSTACFITIYSYPPSSDLNKDFWDYIYFKSDCFGDEEFGSTTICSSPEFKTCSQKFCSGDLCNGILNNYPTFSQPTIPPPIIQPPTTKPPTTEPPTTEPPTTEPPTTESPSTESSTTLFETTVEISTYTSPSSNCPFLSEDRKVDFNCSRFYEDLSKCGRRRAWSCDYSSWRLNMLEVFLKEFADKIPEDSDFKLPKCGNDDGISCESSEKCCYISYSGCQICHCIDHDYKDRTYLQNIWKQDQELWRKLNKFYIDFSSGESEYYETC